MGLLPEIQPSLQTRSEARSRFELKYVIDEARARGIRQFLRSHLQYDRYALRHASRCYPIHSLYLDNWNCDLAQDTLQGRKNRYKLRIRFYDEEGPVFFEIKRREDGVIIKSRVVVVRSSVPRLLAGHWPVLDDLAGHDARGYGILQRFCDLQHRIRAGGVCFVSYRREAYTSPDGTSVRVTFDRDLAGSPYRGVFALPAESQRIAPPVGGVILELKFTDRFPAWMRQMVRVFGLERRSFAKYVTCLQTLVRNHQAPLVGRLPVVAS